MNNNIRNFKAVEATIVPFYLFENDKYYKIDNNGERRLCIIDPDESFVIDVMNGLKYNYIKTINGVYIMPDKLNNIENGKIYAICSNHLNITNPKLIKRINTIISLIEEGYGFIDGNEVLDNVEYNNLKKEEKKYKKFLKRKKR